LNLSLDHLAHERGASKGTLTTYQADLQEFYRILTEEELILSGTQSDILPLRTYLAFSPRPMASTASLSFSQSISRKLSTVRSFLRYLTNQGIFAMNAGRLIKSPKEQNGSLQSLQSGQLLRRLQSPILRLLQACAMLQCLNCFYSSGLRRAEVAGISLNDLNLKDGTVRILGKGNRSESSRWGSKAVEALKNHIDARSAWKIFRIKRHYFCWLVARE